MAAKSRGQDFNRKSRGPGDGHTHRHAAVQQGRGDRQLLGRGPRHRPRAVVGVAPDQRARGGAARGCSTAPRASSISPRPARFYDSHTERILSEIEAANTAVSQLHDEPRGTLRLNIPVVFGRRYIAPTLPEFQERYPDVEVELQVTDHLVDLIEEGADLAIRVGGLTNTSFIARKLTGIKRLMVVKPRLSREIRRAQDAGGPAGPQLPALPRPSRREPLGAGEQEDRQGDRHQRDRQPRLQQRRGDQRGHAERRRHRAAAVVGGRQGHPARRRAGDHAGLPRQADRRGFRGLRAARHPTPATSRPRSAPTSTSSPKSSRPTPISAWSTASRRAPAPRPPRRVAGRGGCRRGRHPG